MENMLLTQARKLYPKGSFFLSASGVLKSPMKVHALKMAENYKNTVVDELGGVIYDGIDKVWAKKL